MTFDYSYKTADGIRHVSQMSAQNKEQVFASLRQMGIRPIRVQQRGVDLIRIAKLVAYGVIVGVVFSVVAFQVFSRNNASGGKARPNICSPQFTERIETIMSQFRETIGNYEISDGEKRDKGKLRQALQCVRQGAEIIEYYRTFVYGIFASETKSGMAAGDELEALKHYYGDVMSRFDVAEEHFKSREYSLMLLYDNWGAWHVDQSSMRVSFDTVALQKEYDFHVSNTDVDSLRWHRDFAPGHQ